ncbi:MAG: hypothetical protein Q8Q23_05350 [bacterium]|nr:hypothetical protein [bacterium]
MNLTSLFLNEVINDQKTLVVSNAYRQKEEEREKWRKNHFRFYSRHRYNNVTLSSEDEIDVEVDIDWLKTQPEGIYIFPATVGKCVVGAGSVQEHDKSPCQAYLEVCSDVLGKKYITDRGYSVGVKGFLRKSAAFAQEKKEEDAFAFLAKELSRKIFFDGNRLCMYDTGQSIPEKFKKILGEPSCTWETRWKDGYDTIVYSNIGARELASLLEEVIHPYNPVKRLRCASHPNANHLEFARLTNVLIDDSIPLSEHKNNYSDTHHHAYYVVLCNGLRPDCENFFKGIESYRFLHPLQGNCTGEVKRTMGKNRICDIEFTYSKGDAAKDYCPSLEFFSPKYGEMKVNYVMFLAYEDIRNATFTIKLETPYNKRELYVHICTKRVYDEYKNPLKYYEGC